jgi:hypothetical protein
MSLEFQMKEDSILLITQKSSIDLVNVIKFNELEPQHHYEGKFQFKNTFTPPDFQQQFFRNCSNIWVIVDEFVFIFVFICVSVV